MSTINEEADEPDAIRLASGVPGLDAVLRGGFLRGGLYKPQLWIRGEGIPKGPRV